MTFNGQFLRRRSVIYERRCFRTKKCKSAADEFRWVMNDDDELD